MSILKFMSLAKIPFGFKIDTQQHVDVHTVESGKNCGCICPSCKVPLIAAHGEKNAWHFRHLSSQFDYLKNECELSFFVSVRMMAKQILEESLVIQTPNYSKKLSFSNETFQSVKSYEITGQRKIELERIKLDEKFESTTVDVLGKVGDYDFIIYITHPGRDLPDSLERPTTTKCGVIQIKIDDWQKEFFHKKEQEKSYTEILINLICNETKSKSWVFHPKQDVAESKARAEYELSELQKLAHLAQLKKNSTNPKILSSLTSVKKSPIIKKSHVSNHYMCEICRRSWDNSVKRCPYCGELHHIISI